MTVISTLRLPLCNAYLLRGTGAILVDTGTPRDAGLLRILLARVGQRLEDLNLVLHTHAHWDHCGSTRQLQQWCSAQTAVHGADAAMMRRGDNGTLKPVGWTARLLKPFLDRRYPAVQPDLLFDGEIDLSAFGVHARVIPTPGHTSGSISIVTAGREAVVGDLIMGGFFGGRLWPSHPCYHYFAEDFAALRRSMRKILDLNPTLIFPGHGGPLAPARVARHFGF